MSSASAASLASAFKAASPQTARKRGTSAASWNTCCARSRNLYAPAEAADDSTLTCHASPVFMRFMLSAHNLNLVLIFNMRRRWPPRTAPRRKPMPVNAKGRARSNSWFFAMESSVTCWAYWCSEVCCLPAEASLHTRRRDEPRSAFREQKWQVSVRCFIAHAPC